MYRRLLALTLEELRLIETQRDHIDRDLAQLLAPIRTPSSGSRKSRALVNTVHLTFLDANSHVHERVRRADEAGVETCSSYASPPGAHGARDSIRPDPGVRQLGQQGLMEGWPVPRGIATARGSLRRMTRTA